MKRNHEYEKEVANVYHHFVSIHWKTAPSVGVGGGAPGISKSLEIGDKVPEGSVLSPNEDTILDQSLLAVEDNFSIVRIPSADGFASPIQAPMLSKSF